MKILCLLANTWHTDPDSLHKLLVTQPDRRHHVIARHLFCTTNLTGSRLLTVFGELLKAHSWTFEHAATTLHTTTTSSSRSNYNTGHIRRLIGQHRPDVIIAIGASPQKAMKDMALAVRDTSPLPPVVECLAPATNRPGWLKKMTVAREQIEAAIAGLGVAA